MKKGTAIDKVDGNYYNSDYDTRDGVIKASNELNEVIASEGITLLKNEDNALPIRANSKVSVFGKNSNALIMGGSGSGSGGGGLSVSLNDALKSANFDVNTTLENFYSDNAKSGKGRGAAPTNGQVSSGYNTGETPIENYTEDIEKSYDTYSDAAIVVISRIAGEGFDLPRSMYYNGSTYGASTTNEEDGTIVPGAREKSDHYLQLDKNESDLIKYCGNHFSKVIVLLNTGSQFECGFLDDPDNYGYSANVKAALWVGYPGSNGMTALAKILKGEINPSGKTTDTWSRDFTKDPTYNNFGNNMVEINAANKGNQYANLPSNSGNGGGGYRNNYVCYEEGIYQGYRYYETRGTTEGNGAYTGDIKGTTNVTWDNWYNAHVVYPFGYGLSYTSFTQEIVSSTPASNATLSKDNDITLKVKVTNTGTVAGKDTVELYYGAPYIDSGIEKPTVNLVAFEKTDILSPGANQIVELKIKAQDMAAYDYNDANKNGFKGYELDKGIYTVSIMSDAHVALDDIKLSVSETITYENDAVTGNEVKNRFDEVSSYIPQYTDENGTTMKYMSRKDFKGTFPAKKKKLIATEAIQTLLKTWDNRPANADESEPYYTAVAPTTDAKNNILLSELVGIEYDDAKWSSFMDQLSVSQMTDLVCNGPYASGQNIPSLGITRAPNADGPAGFIYGAPSGSYNFWCCETVLGATWNKNLAKEKGKLMGNLALWGNGDNDSKICGWYAPACNIHRSPFSGRNFEYYSEDGVISGYMAAFITLGAQEKGLFTYAKHFGLNDQETNRCGLMTWANEQSMREIYFRPYELAVKVGKTHGIMSSLNRIGTTWTGGSYGMYTEILRNEWGFKGSVVTDTYMGDNSGLSNADQMIRAGANLSLGNASLTYDKTSPTTVSCLRKASQGILYANANSCAMNTGRHPTKPSGIDSYSGRALKTGVVNAAYKEDVSGARINKDLFPDSDVEDIVYSLSEGSTLPSGLILSADGTILGTPTEEVNNYLFSITASYDKYKAEASFAVSIVNSGGSIVYQAETDMADATIGSAYNGSVKGASIYKPDATKEEIEKYPEITYSLANGSILPEGLVLNKDGTVTGTATKEAEDYEFTVVASALGYKSKTMTFEISIYHPIEFASKKLADGKLGENYVEKVAKATAENAVTYQLKEGSTLPKGLVLTKGGHITGTPLETVTDKKFTVVASSSHAKDAEAEYSITIGLNYNDMTLPNGKVGAKYSGSVDTAQGAGTITYSLKEGSILPEGLTLSADGKITGTPTKAGNYEFTIVCSAEGKKGDEITLKLFVANADKIDEPSDPSDDKPSENKGCGGSIAAVSSVVGAAVLLGLGLGLKKRKDDKKN